MLSDVLAIVSTSLTYKVGKKLIKYACESGLQYYNVWPYVTTAHLFIDARLPSVVRGYNIYVNALSLLWFNFYFREWVKSLYKYIGSNIEFYFPEVSKAIVTATDYALDTIDQVIHSIMETIVMSVYGLVVDFYELLKFVTSLIYHDIFIPVKDFLLKVPGAVQSFVEWCKPLFEYIPLLLEKIDSCLDWLGGVYEELDLNAFINDLHATIQDIINTGYTIAGYISYVGGGIVTGVTNVVTFVLNDVLPFISWVLKKVDILSIAMAVKYCFEVVAGLEVVQGAKKGYQDAGLAFIEWLKEPSDFGKILLNAGIEMALRGKKGYESVVTVLIKCETLKDFMKQVLLYVGSELLKKGIAYSLFFEEIKEVGKQAIKLVKAGLDDMVEIVLRAKKGYESAAIILKEWWEELDIVIAVVDSAHFKAAFITIVGLISNAFKLNNGLFEHVLCPIVSLVSDEVSGNIKDYLKSINLFDIEVDDFKVDGADIQKEVDVSGGNLNDDGVLVNDTDHTHKATLVDALAFMLAT